MGHFELVHEFVGVIDSFYVRSKAELDELVKATRNTGYRLRKI